MTDLFTKRSGADLAYTFDFTDQVPQGVTISSVSSSVPTGLTLEETEPDLANLRCTLRLSGGAHGHTYEVIATAVLSNSEEVPLAMTLTVFDG